MKNYQGYGYGQLKSLRGSKRAIPEFEVESLETMEQTTRR